MYISYFVILNQILICSIIYAAALEYYLTPIMKYASISAHLFKNRNHGYFFNFPPSADSFLKETKCFRVDFIEGELSSFKALVL